MGAARVFGGGAGADVLVKHDFNDDVKLHHINWIFKKVHITGNATAKCLSSISYGLIFSLKTNLNASRISIFPKMSIIL